MTSRDGLAPGRPRFSETRRFPLVALCFAIGVLARGAVRGQGIVDYPLPTSGIPYGIVSGPDGALWFGNVDRIQRITTSGTITSFAVSLVGNVHGIAVGSDGALWFAESGASRIGRLTTSGTLTHFSVGSGPESITPGPDGALWFTETGGNAIGRITTAGAVTHFPMPGAGPNGITAGPDGNLWFTELFHDKIGRITTAGVVTEFPVLSASPGLYGITAGPDGALWFNESNVSKIGRITTSGTVTETPLPTTTRNFGLAFGPDAALWITEFDASRILRMSLTGTFTEYSIPTVDSGPFGIVAGPDGALWFTEFKGNKIGRVVPPAPVAPGKLFTVAPCRAADTRNSPGAFGGPALAAGTDRFFDLSGRCGVPSSARAVVGNLTITQPSSPGHLTAYPADARLPFTSTINYAAGQTRANNVILPLASGGFLVRCGQASGSVQVILDVTGYLQ
jgi:streptogramin lyase